MNYFAAPLMAANYISGETVERWEQSIYRKMFLLPNDIKGKAITNIGRKSAPAKEVVSRTANQLKLRTSGQSTLRDFAYSNRDFSAKQVK